MGKTFNVNVKYVSDVKRPVDLHVDVLNAQSKTYYAGKWEEFETQAGETTLTIKMPDNNVQEPFLWKVFLTPRGGMYVCVCVCVDMYRERDAHH
jgi:hypothetical protein